MSKPIYVSPDAALSLLWPDLRKAAGSLFDWSDEYVSAGMVVWDVGANVGLFTFSAAFNAEKCGEVLALEPDPFLSWLLTRTLVQSEWSEYQVTVLSVAASDRNEIASLDVAARGRASSSLQAEDDWEPAGGERYSLNVLSVTLDWLYAKCTPPDVLKIDVEGHEMAVLKGARRLLSECGPLVICEVQERNQRWVGSYLRGLGYELYNIEDGRAGRQELQQACYNTLAIPNVCEDKGVGT